MNEKAPSLTLNYHRLLLRPDKEQLLQHRHPWIFSGAIERSPEISHGSLVLLTDRNNLVVATGSYSNRGAIAVRVFDWKESVIDDPWLREKIEQAHLRRQLLGLAEEPHTSTRLGYRVIHGEADSLPGITLDRFADVLVMQLSTAGADQLRDMIIEALKEVFTTCSIVERSESSARSQEGLQEVTKVHYLTNGRTESESVNFEQDGLCYIAKPRTGQKTGFYLDQRMLRKSIRLLAKGRSVLNLFSYTGAHGVAAAAGEAKSVHHVDASAEALAGTDEHWRLNRLATPMSHEVADIFQWLGRKHDELYDMVIVDPPALIKSQKDIDTGQRAYHFLNRAALRLVAPGGIFITSSCSQFFGEADLLTTVRRASLQNSHEVDLLNVIHQGADHPRSLFFPEGHYLTSLVCLVR